MRKRTNPPLPTRSLQHARDLRQVSTDLERRLWFHLRAGRLRGLKFRRQHPVPPYIVDFCCVAAKLVIELDGSQHGPEADRIRTRFLERSGYRVLRFWDNEVLKDLDAVLEVIGATASQRTLTPTPLPAGEGLTSEER
ncbi:endonuclease domain-containing protein [Dyella lutea]|uniref:DUF559 domain-containing protein n=1 Tax=Dyella lutea TaxID=2950441 RepID=A0ABT1F7P7_9GAMM|nr:DUF559 domain-containing protein [Dyella lutea]MCP1373390.1 DUF559 domain-containing protein [Dyella lutea]